jgi:hypothetical protein
MSAILILSETEDGCSGFPLRTCRSCFYFALVFLCGLRASPCPSRVSLDHVNAPLPSPLPLVSCPYLRDGYL